MYDIPKDDLAEKYIDEGLSIEDCADHFGCSTSTIEDRLRRYDLPIRSRGNQPLETTRKELQRLYVEKGLSTIEIGDRLECHPSTISKKLKEHGIATTGANHSRSIRIQKDELIRLYVDEQRTTYELAARYDCDPTVIERRLRWYDIGTGHTSAGDGEWQYKYGSSWRRQRRKALARADHRCERCGVTDEEHREIHVDPTRGVGVGLDVHHRISVRLFRRWDRSIEDANDLGNLEVLCQACHRRYGDRVGTCETPPS